MLVVACSMAMAGCGFRPMLAVDNTGASVTEEFAKIQIGSIENRSGQILRNDLINMLTPKGEPDRPEYRLNIRIIEPRQNLAYQRNDSVTYAGFSVTAYCYLFDSNGAVLTQFMSASSSNYSISNSQYATVASVESTRERIMQDVSQDIRNKIGQYFDSRLSAQARK